MRRVGSIISTSRPIPSRFRTPPLQLANGGAVRAFAVLRDARVGEGPLLGRELESQLPGDSRLSLVRRVSACGNLIPFQASVVQPNASVACLQLETNSTALWNG